MSSQTITLKQGICKTQDDEPVSPITSTETIYRGNEKLSDILDTKLSVTITNEEEINVGIDTDTIIDKINEVESIIGETDNSGGDSTTGTIFAKLNKIITSINELTGLDLSIEGLDDIVNNIGTTSDSEASNNTGTVMGKLNKVIDNTSNINIDGIDNVTTLLGTTSDSDATNNTGTVMGKLNKVIDNTENIDISNIGEISTLLGTTSDSEASNNSGTISGKINKLLTDYTSERANSIDLIKSMLEANNSIIKSIQSGSFTINATLSSSSGSSVREYTAEFSQVDVSKSIPFVSGYSFLYNGNGDTELTTIVSSNPYISSFSETSLTITAPAVISNNEGDKIKAAGYWFVIEFK